MKILRFMAVIWVIFAIPIAVFGKVYTETIGGTVLNGDGRPVAGASVTIQTSDGRHPHATHTDAGGHFQFTRFELGQYDLRASFRGTYSAWTKRVLLRLHKPADITLRLGSPSKR